MNTCPIGGIKTFNQLKTKAKKAVENYNTKRIHRALPDKNTPVEFEKKIRLYSQKRPMMIIYAKKRTSDS